MSFDTSFERSHPPNYRRPHVFDPIHNGADECECGLTSDADIHKSVSDKDKAPYDPKLAELIAALVEASFDCGQFDDSEVHSESYEAIYRRQVEASEGIKNYVATVRREAQANFVNNITAVLDADDVERFTTLIMKAKASPDLETQTRSALKSEVEIRREAREESQQRVFAEAIRQGVGAIKAATIASAALERAATDSQDGGE